MTEPARSSSIAQRGEASNGMASAGTRRLIRGLAIALSLVLGAGMVEGATRVVQWLRYGSSVSIYSFEKDPKSGLKIPVPGKRAGSRISIHINSQGFRGPELEVPKPAARIRVAFLGGSTTFSAEASRDESTWPHLVWQALQSAHPRRSFDYVNAGVPGYRMEELLLNLQRRVQFLEPDVIVIYEATNDLSYDTRKLAEAQGIYEHKRRAATGLARWSVAWSLIEKNMEILANQRAAGGGNHRLTFDPALLSRGFEAKLVELVEFSKRRAPVVAVATFSHKLRRGQSRDQQLQAANTALYYMPYMSIEGLLAGYEEYNRVIREVAKKTQVILIDDQLMIPGDDRHFNDSVHFTDLGNSLMAERVTRYLNSSQSFKDLIRAP